LPRTIPLDDPETKPPWPRLSHGGSFDEFGWTSGHQPTGDATLDANCGLLEVDDPEEQQQDDDQPRYAEDPEKQWNHSVGSLLPPNTMRGGGFQQQRCRSLRT
jgi:hypothetical protein